MKTTTHKHPKSNRTPSRSASLYAFGVTTKHIQPCGFPEGRNYYIHLLPENHSPMPRAAGARRVLNGSKLCFATFRPLSKQRLGFA